MIVESNKGRDINLDWKVIFNAMSDLVMILDLDHKIIAVNPAVEKILSKPEAELIGTPCYKIFHCANLSVEGCPHDALIKSGHPETADMEMAVLRGTYLVTVAPIRDSSGSLIKTIHIAKDITARKNSEEQALKINRALHTLIEFNQLLTHIKDEKELVLRICRMLVDRGGYKMVWAGYAVYEGEYRIKPVAWYSTDIDCFEEPNVDWGDMEPGECPACMAIRTGSSIVCRDIKGYENCLPWKIDSARLGYSSSITLPLTSKGITIGVFNLYAEEKDFFDKEEVALLEELAAELGYGIVSLRTEIAHRKAKTTLNSAENKYKRLVEMANDAIFIADAETGMIIEANRAAEKLVGFPIDKILTMNQVELYPPEDREYYTNIFKQHVEDGRGVSMDVFIRNTKGEDIPVQISASVFDFGDRKVIQGIFRDVTYLKRAEEKIRQSQKMEAIGSLAGGIAHDLNNMLSPILGYTELVMNDMEKGGAGYERLNNVLKAASRARDLVKQILRFSRKEEVHRQPVLIQSILQDTTKLLQSTIPATIEVNISIDQSVHPVMADPTEVQQVILNLATNAYQAIGNKKGVIDVTLERVKMKGEDVSGSASETANYACLKIHDSGGGISSKDIGRIFEPYFTTKIREEGTGIGLSVVHTVVTDSGGRINVESDEGVGTTFSIYFPEISVPGKPCEEEKKDAPPVGSERVLLVDDDEDVLRVMTEIISRLGYLVTPVSNPLKALELFEKAPDDFDLIVTDQTMPKMTGMELVGKIFTTRPGFPSIIISGYSHDVSLEDVSTLGIGVFLNKPVSRKELATAIRGVLGEGNGGTI